MKGRRPNSPSESKLLGFPGKRSEVETPGAEPQTLVKPPLLLKGALEVWDRLLPIAPGIRAEHAEAFADLCNCAYRLSKLERRIEREGLVIQGAKGTRKNPALQIAREYRQAFQRACEQFGLTPVAAARLGKGAKPKPAGGVLNGQWK